jgi:hypothetical protein
LINLLLLYLRPLVRLKLAAHYCPRSSYTNVINVSSRTCPNQFKALIVHVQFVSIAIKLLSNVTTY